MKRTVENSPSNYNRKEATPREELIHELERIVRRGEDARKKFIESMGSVSDTLYAIRWIGDSPEILGQAELAEHCIKFLDDNQELGTKEALATMVDEIAAQRARWYPEHSTSPWSNAVNDCRFTALRRFQEELNTLKRYFQD